MFSSSFSSLSIFIGRALGFETRIVVDLTDHVWSEIYDERRNQWISIDTGEEKSDTPLLYEAGWGKKLTYCFACSGVEVVDVTRRYTRQWDEVLKRRDLASEEWVAQFLEAKNAQLAARIADPEERERIRTRRLREIAELEGRSNADEQREPKAQELEGRITGDKEWKDQRGEK